MTATALTANIAGTIYPVLNGFYTLSDKVDQRSTVSLTIFDANGTYSFQYGQSVVITDTLEGVKFTGYVHKPSGVKYAANAAIAYTIDCIDKTSLTDWATTNKTYINQYAGVIAAGMVNDVLSAEGITANYAIREDHTQAEFGQGTLSNTVASSNLGGDLELALAGTPVVYNNLPGIFSGSTLAIKFVGTSSQGYNNNYNYRMIYSDGSTTVATGDALSYDVWIQSDSPQIMAGVDIVFTDGTTFRDSTDAGHDSQGLGPHPNTDLSGLADNNAWYSRGFGVAGALIGKTIQYFSIAFEGDTKGVYTAYFRNIQFKSSGGVKVHVFDSTQTTLQANAALQSRGYSNISVSTVSTHAPVINQVVDTVSIDAAKIVKSSYMNWEVHNTAFGANNAVIQAQINSSATSPAAIVETSIDNGASWQSISNNSAIPNLQPGMSISGRSIQYRATLLPSLDPAIIPYLGNFNIIIQPAYQATKSDSITTATTQANFNAGTYSNTQGLSGGGVSILGYTQNYDGAWSQTLYGTTQPYHFIYLKTLGMQTAGATDARSRIDQAGQWANFIAEIDIQVSTNYALGLVYRTTNWGNSNDSYAYSVTVTLASILFARGNNSTGAGSFHQISNITSISLAEGSWHRLKIIANGSNHQIFLDGASYINTTDGTYTAAGYLGTRIFTGSSPLVTGYFDNFGVVSSLTGQWTSQSISLASLGNYGTSMIEWDTNQIPDSCQVTAVTSINGGSTYQAVTNGGAISGLTNGQSLSGKNLLVQLQLTAGDATAIPVVSGVTAWVQGQYSASGTRVSPVLSLSNALIAGSTVVNWTAVTPTNTSVTVATSPNGSSSWTNVNNGDPIAGITTQPAPMLDTFAVDDHTSYTHTVRTGGSAGTFTFDTTHSRLSVTGGTNDMLLWTAISVADIDIVLDLDQSDRCGLVWRESSASNFYELDIYDDSSNAGLTNVIQLYKVVSNVKTQLGSNATIALPRGTPKRVRVTMVGTAITVLFEGTSIISTTDSSLAAAGKAGIIEVSGIGRFYNFRLQPQGQSLSGVNAYSKIALTSTDPTATPQLTDLVLCALHPNIGLGSLVSTVAYQNTYISANLDDLAKKSSTYYWNIDHNSNFIFSDRYASPAPWVLTSTDQKLLLDGPLTVEYVGDLYHNRHTCTGVNATAVFSETKIGDGTSTSWALGNNVAAVPTITLNGQLQTVGQKGIDTGKDFYYQLGNNSIDQDSSGTVLQQTDTLSISYTGSYVTSVTVDNTGQFTNAGTTTQSQFAAIAGGTGRVTVVEDVSSLNLDIPGATSHCNGQLIRDGVIGRVITFKTWRTNPSLGVGQYIAVFIPEHGINDAAMLITQIDTTQDITIDTASGNPTHIYYQTCTACETANLGSGWKFLASAFQ